MIKKTAPKKIFSSNQEDEIKAAIAHAERLTSGEIRLFVDSHCKSLDPVLEAGKIFQKLKMHKTKLRNGVLIYLAISDHKFAIIGDRGIHEKVGDDFWRETRELMLNHFKNNQVVEGIIAGIKKAGECLAKEFPNQDDHNEISNEIAFRS